ncbi:glycosyltransferase family 2 protein [Thermodesulfobacteriota bacterium]
MISDIAYLILNYNPDGEKGAQEILGKTIDSFYSRKSESITCDVFVLDQGTAARHREWLVEKQLQYGFSAILLNRNIGISGAINLFVRTSKSPVVGLITSDVIITSGMDEDLYTKVQIPEVYQAMPFTDKSDLDYQTWQPKEAFGSDHVDLTALKNKGESLIARFSNRATGGYLRCIGAELNVVFWRKSIFDKIGYFDERWKACYENNDFSLRCFLDGGCTVISRDSFVWHYHQITEKNKARDKIYDFDNWSEISKNEWDKKWSDLNKYLDIYKPLKKKTISDYPKLYNKFKHNIYLPYEQSHTLTKR